MPDSKLQYVVDLLTNLSFVKIDKPTHDYIVTEEHIALVREEYKKADENPDYALDWYIVKDQFKVD